MIIYTDGSCSNTGNKQGGWAAIILLDTGDVFATLTGMEENTTSNRMELLAVIESLTWLRARMPVLSFGIPDDDLCSIHVRSDSQYICKGVTTWLPEWKKNSWKTSSKKSVANKDLWEQLEHCIKEVKIPVWFSWVKAHADDSFNNCCDELAKKAARG